MMKCESTGTENMYNFANEHQQDTNIKKTYTVNLSEAIVSPLSEKGDLGDR